MTGTALKTISIKVAGQERPFYFRPGTSDEPIIRDVLLNREYDLKRLCRWPELVEFARRTTEATGKHPIIIDAGANIGAATVFFCGEIPNAWIVAIEPDTSNFDLLTRNVAGLNVKTLHAALASSAGQARVVDPGEGHWGLRTERTDEGSVACITIDEIYRQIESTFFPFMVKIDIEGGEDELFSQNTKWVERTPLIIVELHDWLLPKTAASGSFLRCVAPLDRDFINIGENVYSVTNSIT